MTTILPAYADHLGLRVNKPTSVIIDGGRVHGPTDSQLAESGIYRAVATGSIPDGHRVTGYEFAGIDGGRAMFTTLTEPIPTEAERIAELVTLYGEQVAQIAGLLQAFGLVMPLTQGEIAARCYAAIKADPTLSADSQMLDRIRSGLPITDADLYACAVAKGLAEAPTPEDAA